MACNQETLLLLSRYANGEATAAESAHSAAHVESCPDCRELLNDWQNQRQLLVWATTLELPELSPNTLRAIAQREEPMSAPIAPSRRIAWPRLRINRTWSYATMVTAVTLGLGYMYASQDFLFTPRLPAGTSLGSAVPVVRVRSGVVLELGPNTRVTRLGNDRIRLEAGWLRATVRHGSGLRIQTKRLEVSDIGTIFQVNAGPSTDSVTVEEGEVSVSRGGKTYPVRGMQVLFGSDKGEPSVHSFPARTPEEDEEGQPLFNPADAFYPQSSDSLDWREGQRRLATAFPAARTNGTGNQAVAWARGNGAIRFHAALAQGVRKELRAHFAGIARAQSSAADNIGVWGFPVAYLMLDDVAFPQGLGTGTYEVRMVADGSRLLWRFTSSLGKVVDSPVAFERRPEFRSGSSGSSSASSGNFAHYLTETGCGTALAFIRFEDWPGDLKPTLRLELKPLAGFGADARTMEADLIRQTAGIPNLTLENPIANLMYLDWNRSHHLMVAWSKDAGRQLDVVLNAASRGRGGAAVMGVVATDVTWVSPAFPKGTYILRWVIPSPGQAPHWEVEPLNGGAAIALAIPSRRERIREESRGGGGYGFAFSRAETRRQLNVELGCAPAENGAFTFRFALTDQSRNPPRYGEGWLRVKQP